MAFPVEGSLQGFGLMVIAIELLVGAEVTNVDVAISVNFEKVWFELSLGGAILVFAAKIQPAVTMMLDNNAATTLDFAKMWFERMLEVPMMIFVAKIEVAVGMLLKEHHRADLKDLPNVTSLKRFVAR